jgi:hypothetical protein
LLCLAKTPYTRKIGPGVKPHGILNEWSANPKLSSDELAWWFCTRSERENLEGMRMKLNSCPPARKERKGIAVAGAIGWLSPLLVVQCCAGVLLALRIGSGEGDRDR